MSFTPGGVFARIAGTTEIEVNSLHGQGIDRPAPGLALEGHAPDGTPEAVSVTGAKRPDLGGQWHPEYKPIQTDLHTDRKSVVEERVRQYGEMSGETVER